MATITDAWREAQLETAIAFVGETINVVYRPFTREAEALLAAPEEGRSSGTVSEVLAEVLVSWDLEGEDGRPHPITHESLADLPLDFNNAILHTLADDLTKRGAGLGEVTKAVRAAKGSPKLASVLDQQRKRLDKAGQSVRKKRRR